MRVYVTRELKEIRNRKGFSRAGLAFKISISDKTIQRAEEGKRISLLNAEAIARGLGIDKSEIIDKAKSCENKKEEELKFTRENDITSFVDKNKIKTIIIIKTIS